VLASLPRQDRHKPKSGPVRPSKVSRKRAYVLIGVHVAIGLHFLHWGVTGQTITPVEPSEAMQTLELGRVNAGFLLFVTLIASTLVFGRWFCGWGCHLVALQDLCAWMLGKIGLKPRPVRSRLLVLAPFVVAFYMFAWPQVADLIFSRPPRPEWEMHLFTNDLWQTFPKWIMAPVSVLLLGFLIVWWLGAKGFCTHGCPYGAVFAITDRFAPMRIKVTDACDACGHCTTACSSNVRVHEEVAKHGMIVDPGCMKCFDCVSVCPKEALYFGAAVPKPFAVSQQRIQARADFTWPEEIALAGIAVWAAQFAFREVWFGEHVPFLLSVGLGVLTAVFALLGWRLVSRSAVTFQHTVLKADGRFTRAGRFGVLGVGLWLLFAVHTCVGKTWRGMAIEAATEPLSAVLLKRGTMPREQVDAAVAKAPAALASVDGALAWDLVDDPDLLTLRGLLLFVLGRHVEAEAALWVALGDREGLSEPTANVVLAQYCMDRTRQRYEDARRLLQYTVRVHGNQVAASLLEQLQARPK
jgi:NAD-dependent dihydropyrimidine dehydrogenase PreA subunit